MILSNINNNHFRIWYYNNNNIPIDTDYKIKINQDSSDTNN